MHNLCLLSNEFPRIVVICEQAQESVSGCMQMKQQAPVPCSQTKTLVSTDQTLVPLFQNKPYARIVIYAVITGSELIRMAWGVPKPYRQLQTPSAPLTLTAWVHWNHYRSRFIRRMYRKWTGCLNPSGGRRSRSSVSTWTSSGRTAQSPWSLWNSAMIERSQSKRTSATLVYVNAQWTPRRRSLDDLISSWTMWGWEVGGPALEPTLLSFGNMHKDCRAQAIEYTKNGAAYILTLQYIQRLTETIGEKFIVE